MIMATAPTRQYVRRLEQALAERAEGPRVFTQKDYRLATGWHDAGIPVGLILELLSGRKVPAKSLAQIASRVEEAWKAVCAGRIRESAEQAGKATREPDRASRLRTAVDQGPGSGPLHNLLTDLLQACRSGAAAEELERILEERLPGAVPAERLQAAEEEARKSLASHGRRMPPAARSETVRKGALARLRREFRIPRLS